MRLEVQKYLHDVQEAVKLLAEFTSGKSLEEYETDAMLRAAVEREFEVVGEALAHLAKLDRHLISSVSEYERIIAFRNILIHGYADVDDRLVWDIVQTKLPVLTREIEALLGGS